jgi:hypothetical protein
MNKAKLLQAAKNQFLVYELHLKIGLINNHEYQSRCEDLNDWINKIESEV